MIRHSIIISLTICVLVVSMHSQTDSISVRIIKEKNNFIRYERVWLAIEAVNFTSRDVRLDVGVLDERCSFIRDLSDTLLLLDLGGHRIQGGWLVRAGDTSTMRVDFGGFASSSYGMNPPGNYQFLFSTYGYFDDDSSGQSLFFSDTTTFSVRPISESEWVVVDSINNLLRVLFSRDLNEAEIEFIESYRNDEIYIVILFITITDAMNSRKPLTWTEFVCEFIRTFPNSYYAVRYADIALYMEPNYEGLHDKVIEAGRNAPTDSRIYLWLVKEGFIVEEE